MKLLFDENLSPRLANRLADILPASSSVDDSLLRGSSDDDVWHFAIDHNMMIVSKDTDFYDRSMVNGHPPKVICIRFGNCSTSTIEQVLRQHHKQISGFEANITASFIVFE